MSAYIVSKNHITFLIAAALSPRILNNSGCARWYHREQWQEMPRGDYDRAAEVGNMLWRENVRSVAQRYPGDKTSATLPGPVGGSFLITPRDINRIFEVIDPVQVLKSCHCYSYQTCESNDWEQTEAHAFIKSLEGLSVRALPGYDAAEWGAPEPMGNHVISLSDLAKRRS